MNSRYLDEVSSVATRMAKVVAVCGMPGSGKGEFAQLMSNHSIPVRSMGDMVRAEVKLRGVVESPTIYGEVAAQLRAEFGEDVLAVRLADEVDNLLKTNSLVLIEGMRGTAEYDIFSSRWGENFSSVAIVASQDIRYNRTQMRGRSEDGDYEQFLIREKRESGWGLLSLIDSSDFHVLNEGTLEEFTDLCNKWLEGFGYLFDDGI
tara:strand:- start:1635 stop:2249 length:615 start_codon:yes stop_codon:yes gene_type:complete